MNSNDKSVTEALLANENIIWSTLSFLVVIVAYWTTAVSLGKTWLTYGSYTHGFVVLTITFYLVYRAAESYPRTGIASPLLFVPALILSLVWLISGLVGIQLGQQMILPLLWLTLLVAAIGMRAGIHFSLPILFLFFAIPLWDYLNPLLQALTTNVVGQVLKVLSIPAFIEGYRVTIPAGHLEIAEGCSGLRYFLISMTLTVLFAYLQLTRFSTQLLFVGIGILFSLIANWFRVSIVILIAHVWGIQNHFVANHDWIGWVVFGLVLIPLFRLGGRLHLVEERKGETNGGPSIGQEGQTQSKMTGFGGSARRVGWVVPAWLAGIIGPVLLLSMGLMPGSGAELHVKLEMESTTSVGGKWIAPQSDWQPAYNGGDDRRNLSFRDQSGKIIELRIVAYGRQSQGNELIYYGNRIADGRKWKVVRQSAIGLKGTADKVRVAILQNSNGQQLVVLYWYQVGNWRGIVSWRAKLQQAIELMRGDRQSALIAIAAKCDPGCDSAQETLDRFREQNSLFLQESRRIKDENGISIWFSY